MSIKISFRPTRGGNALLEINVGLCYVGTVYDNCHLSVDDSTEPTTERLCECINVGSSGLLQSP